MKVLVVDDEPQLVALIKRILERAGFEIIAIHDGRAAHETAVDTRPDAVLLDLMLGNVTGDSVFAELRKDFRTRLIPVIFLTVRSSIKDKVEHLMAGADDYVTKPFIGEELVARLRAVITRATTARELSPLTGMSGNSDILGEITKRLVSRKEFAVLYADIDNFKSYNDNYGFIRGDDVIKKLGSIILEVLEDQHSPAYFAGHVGGDDFVILTEPGLAEDTAAEITRRFDEAAPAFYDAADQERGWIEVEDRSGTRSKAAIASVSIGRVIARNDRFASATAVAVAAAQDKSERKRSRTPRVVTENQRRRVSDRLGRGDEPQIRAAEVRDLLSVIVGYAELASNESNDPAKVLGDLSQIHIAALRAINLMHAPDSTSNLGSELDTPQ
jgi:diguanylate cyclase (GGDEF)-like protein